MDIKHKCVQFLKLNLKVNRRREGLSTSVHQPTDTDVRQTEEASHVSAALWAPHRTDDPHCDYGRKITVKNASGNEKYKVNCKRWLSLR